MKNKLKIFLVTLLMFAPFLASLGKALPVEAASTVTINLHKIRFGDDQNQTMIQNTGEIMNEFKDAQGFGGVEYKIYNVTDQFYTLLETTNPITTKKYTMEEASERVKSMVPAGEPVDTQTTATTGNVGDLTFANLSDKTNGKNSVYVLIETPMNGVTPADNMVVVLPVKGSTGDALTTIHLYPKTIVETAGLEVEKISNMETTTGDKVPLEGTQFVIHRGGMYHTTGTQYLKEFDASETPIWTTVASEAHKFSTSTDGKFREERLLYGTYYLTEITAKNGYAINNDAINQTFTLSETNKTQKFTGNKAIKNDDISVKKINTGGSVNIGDRINYSVTTKIPCGIRDEVDTTSDGKTDAKRYTSYTIKDTHGTLLKLATNTLTLSDGTTTFASPTDYIVDTTIVGEFNVKFTPAGIAKLTPNAILTLSYEMELLQAAVPGTESINSVKVETAYDSDTANGSAIYTGGYNFKKVDHSNGDAALKGAKFVVRDTDSDSAKYLTIGTNGEVTWGTSASGATIFTSGSEGLVTIKGLKNGTYYLEETETPNDKYVLLENRLPFEVTKTSYTTTVAAPMSVENKQKGSLPSTGGSGIYLMMAAGVVVMAVVGGLYFRSHRKEV